MKYLLVLTVIFVTAAFGIGVNDAFLEGSFLSNGGHIGTKDPGGIYDRLVTSETEIYGTAIAFGQVGPYWMADDCEAFDDYSYYQYRLHYVCANDTPVADTFFEVFESDLNTAPFADFVVNGGDITETTTGWTFAGRDIYLGEFPFPSDVSLTDANAYWTAISMDSNDAVFAIMCNEGSPNWSFAYQNDGNGWVDPGYNIDMSMRMDGIEHYIAIESTSLGQIKASFR